MAKQIKDGVFGSKSKKDFLHQWTVESEGKLLEFLFDQLNQQSKTSVKAFLKNRHVHINGDIVTKFDAHLSVGDRVAIARNRGRDEWKHSEVRILWEDSDLIVIDKNAGVSVVGGGRGGRMTVVQLLSKYVKEADSSARIHLLTRMDKDMSGLQVFAKNRQVQNLILARWNQFLVRNSFDAVVEGGMKEKSGVLTPQPSDQGAVRTGKVLVAMDIETSTSLTNYRTVKESPRYSLLDLRIMSGRRNQIRQMLSAKGHPIVGDMVNGAESNPKGRVLLHCKGLEFVHPYTKERLKFVCPSPKMFIGTISGDLMRYK